MHFQCKKEDLFKAVNLVEKAVATQETLQILMGIHLKANDNQLVLTSTNLELTIQTKIPVHTTRTGETVISGKLFASIIKKLPNETIVFERKDNQLLITAGTIEFSLNTLTTEDFPAFPEIKQEILSISSKVMFKMIKNTVFATHQDETRPFLSGVLFEIENDSFSMVATDSNRLAYINTTLPHAVSKSHKMIVPSKALNEIARSLPNDESLVELYSLKKQLVFRIKDSIIITRLIDSQFPNYQAVFPGEQPIKVTLKRNSMLQAVERASLFDKDGTQPVIFEVTSGVLEIKTPQSEVGQLCEQINVEHIGEDGKAAYSSRFVLDMLKSSDAELVTLEYNSDLRQAALKPAQDEQHLYVLMPMRY